MTKQTLKVVSNPKDPLEGYDPLIIATKDILDTYWSQTAEILQPCIDTMYGEMTMQDVYEGILAGRMYCIIAKNDTGEIPDVALAMIMETATYPRFTALHITAIGGRQLDLFQSKFWNHVCSWAFMSGVRKMQASVSPAMARIVSRYGFEKVYEMVRMDLTEM